MKRAIFLLLIAILTISEAMYGQTSEKKVEVLYFKANLACCRARACNVLQSDVESVLKKYFADKNIEFKEIRLADEANKDLVAKYNAKSQTVIIVSRKGKEESSIDVSEIVQEYVRYRDRQKFENEMKQKINEAIN